MTTSWLSIIGIGEDGLAGLSSAARTLLGQARLVVGGARHLRLAAPLSCETMAWPSPLMNGISAVLARRGEPVCVLASGDPFFYGIGAALAAHVSPAEILCLPAPSCFSLAASRLCWPLAQCRLLSQHGRALERIIPVLQPNARLLCLTWDETSASRLAALLVQRGFGQSRLHVLEALGGPRERTRTAVAETFSLPGIDPLNVVAIEVEAGKGACVVPLTPGLPDEWFEHDGQLTKREVRALTLSALRPHRGARLWDIGAGAGSVAIEWMLSDPMNQAVAIEENSERAERIARNAAALGVPGLHIVTGRAPAALADVARPDAVFVGGGGSEAAVIEAAWRALPPGGRIVANAVTLETQEALIRHHAQLGGDLTSIAVAHADQIGRFRGWRPAMPVTQWAADKPWGSS